MDSPPLSPLLSSSLIAICPATINEDVGTRGGGTGHRRRLSRALSGGSLSWAIECQISLPDSQIGSTPSRELVPPESPRLSNRKLSTARDGRRMRTNPHRSFIPPTWGFLIRKNWRNPDGFCPQLGSPRSPNAYSFLAGALGLPLPHQLLLRQIVRSDLQALPSLRYPHGHVAGSTACRALILARHGFHCGRWVDYAHMTPSSLYRNI